MAADWHVHIIEPPLTTLAMKCIFHNHCGHKLENFNYKCPIAPPTGSCQHKIDLMYSDSVPITSKYWPLPPSNLDPDILSEILKAFDDFDVITQELINHIDSCYTHSTHFPDNYNTPKHNLDEVEFYRNRTKKFLTNKMGKQLFAVPW